MGSTLYLSEALTVLFILVLLTVLSVLFILVFLTVLAVLFTGAKMQSTVRRIEYYFEEANRV